MYRKILAAASLFVAIGLQSCKTQESTTAASAAPTAVTEEVKGPKAAKEFRAAWVATVANINWPSKPGLSTEEQQKEAIALLDFLQQHNYNAVIFQVRPATDALYKSDLEPWSYYLTGEQGKAPEPYYDPLEFWIEEAHDRGLELHVWLNPYRAHHTSGGPISEQSIVNKKPELVVKLKQGYYWLDPAHQGTQDHSYEVVMDLVKRYDLDGVHFDDYFYPYSSYNNEEDFPDDATWAAYQQSGGQLSRDDWRRQAVNQFIERLYTGIKKEKPYVKFGLSPFGIWRPGHPESIQGLDQYNALYADAKLWLNKGWVDYFSPQLYWKINQIPQSYPVLLGWWEEQNLMKRHLWPGISIGRDSSAININEIKSQIMISRGMLPQSPGVVHWSISQVTKNPPMAKALLQGPYRQPALVPTSPWLDNEAPKAPEVTTLLLGDSVKVSWVANDEKDTFRWVVYYQYGNVWNYKILNRKDREIVFPLGRATGPLRQRNDSDSTAVQPAPIPLTRVAVAAVDRTGNEGPRKEEEIKR
ncbi:glycoside hydrolase family 10 protein [Rufibacter roseus]|uniref:Glycoside hydrolase family 10 protein n=1 Tax=Rufibacter roseus TaxID=1567108 RepID=A0ABW2DIE7_9BACT|nr:family 10 glycosylhydrolase [Rufibacter roseus]